MNTAAPIVPFDSSSRQSHLAQKRRVMIVEDEMLVAMLLEDFLDDLGHSVVGVAATQPQAMALIERESPDFAILDVNIADGRSTPIADALVERGIPFMFATGYGAQGLLGAYADRIVLQKPYDEMLLAAAMQQALARAER